MARVRRIFTGSIFTGPVCRNTGDGPATWSSQHAVGAPRQMTLPVIWFMERGQDQTGFTHTRSRFIDCSLLPRVVIAVVGHGQLGGRLLDREPYAHSRRAVGKEYQLLGLSGSPTEYGAIIFQPKDDLHEQPYDVVGP